MNSDQNQDMDLAHSASLPSSRTLTPVLTNCDRLQIAQDEIKKFSILLSNVSHTINAIESCVQEKDPELIHLYSRQEYLYERRQAAISYELTSLFPNFHMIPYEGLVVQPYQICNSTRGYLVDIEVSTFGIKANAGLGSCSSLVVIFV
ncbi:hypothetical protein TNIN_28551 [Trichonephila inaurata madagascariensis]|uniref:Uncharacterized protein n=1 Tax=Trichonephila inaurata madagascariensis TaxID=2747483 RepID=A0A8X6WS89_9ARAC|nr:hypothetical protein TNIN_28551 [Trichonephila inaurata madagascariensis]